MVEGVSKGFSKELEINGVGYKAALQGKQLVLNLGYSHPINYDAPDGITFEVPSPLKVVIKGADKQQVGQVASEIRGYRPPEPYLGKGVKYVDEKIRRKAGKSGKSK
jgi:large subunit ribosomal protein L6